MFVSYVLNSKYNPLFYILYDKEDVFDYATITTESAAI